MASGDYAGQLRSRPQEEKEIDTSQGVVLPRPLWLWEVAAPSESTIH